MVVKPDVQKVLVTLASDGDGWGLVRGQISGLRAPSLHQRYRRMCFVG